MKNTFFKDYQNLMQDINKLSKTADNPFFNSKYVQLKTILQEVKRVCIANNFIFTQYLSDGNITTKLIHKNGEVIKSRTPIIAKDMSDPQKYGAGITYLRRYALTTLFLIEEEDDDGNTASSNLAQRTKKEPF